MKANKAVAWGVGLGILTAGMVWAAGRYGEPAGPALQNRARIQEIDRMNPSNFPSLRAEFDQIIRVMQAQIRALGQPAVSDDYLRSWTMYQVLELDAAYRARFGIPLTATA